MARPSATAASSCCVPSSPTLYDAFETPRAVRGEIEALGPADARAYMRGRARAHRRGASPTRGVGDGVICEMVLRHELQHSETMRQTMAIAGLLPAGEPALTDAPLAADAQAMAGSRSPPAAFAMGAGDGRLRLRQRAPAPRRRAGRVPRSRAARSATRAGCTSARAAATSGASGGRARAGRGRRSTTSPIIPRSPPATRRRPHATSPGSRPTPSPARTTRVCPPRRSGRRRRPGPRSHGSGLAGVGPVWEWTVYLLRRLPRLHRLPLPRVLARCSSASATACCAAARGQPTRASRARTFRNWDLPQRRQIFAGVRLAREA